MKWSLSQSIIPRGQLALSLIICSQLHIVAIEKAIPPEIFFEISNIDSGNNGTKIYV